MKNYYYCGIQGLAADAHNKSLLYQQGWQWWINADKQWKTIIGAITFEESISYDCNCIYSNGMEDFFSVDSPEDCDDEGAFFCEVFSTTEYIMIEEGSDGIVPVSSATAYPGADTGPDNAMVGSNHQQMRNDGNLRLKLEELFAGDHGQYFRTVE